MNYINTSVLITHISDAVNQDWVISEETNFLKKEILARGAYLLLTPVTFAAGCLDTILGAIAGVGALCTAGRSTPMLKVSYNHLNSSQSLIARSYIHLLAAINPEFEMASCSIFGFEIKEGGNGLLSDAVIEKFKDQAGDYRQSNNFLKRHVATRLTYALMAVSCVVTRLVDGIIGVPAACLSILLVGRCAPMNNIASEGLQATGIINDFFYCTVKFINPWSTGLEDRID